MTIYYQSPEGESHDITPSVLSAKWTTKQAGSPAKLELVCDDSFGISWEHGGVYSVKEGERGIFYGYGVSLSKNESKEASIMACDQLFYLRKNVDTYSFENKRADEITRLIAEKLEIETGELANTEYVIPYMTEDGQTMLDAILRAVSVTFENTGRIFVLWDDFGSLRLSDPEEEKLDLVLGDGSLATGYSYSSDIESDTYNRIKLIRDDKDAAKRRSYVFEDPQSIELWGLLQSCENLDMDLNEAEINERGKSLLQLKNRPARSFELSAISDPSCRAGRAVFVHIEGIGVKQFFLIEEASHDLLDETMTLRLRIT